MSEIDETHDPELTSWVASADNHPEFPIQNLPLGVFQAGDEPASIGAAIGDSVLDLRAAEARGLLANAAHSSLGDPSLNALFAASAEVRRKLRRHLSRLLSDPDWRGAVEPTLRSQGEIDMRLPAAIGDYTDFYVGIHHATNIGRVFRPDSPLLPNYKYVPIGYHGRASSVRPSGEAVVRPQGQRKAPDAEAPVLGPSQRLDYELELGIWVGGGNTLGEPIPIGAAPDHIAGLCLLNDWSARDLQAWEYQPLGPFLAKNFLTSVSPWVVTTEALAPFRIAQPPRPPDDPQPLPYLWDAADQREGALSIALEVRLTTAAMRAQGAAPHRLSHGHASDMYWTFAQLITHHTSGGCNLNPGDLLGTGTISAASADGYGSLMEISGAGARSVSLPSGETRTFLEDGDEVTLTAQATAPGRRSIGFGACVGRVAPARRPA